jgi:hypothetical protein
LLGIKVIKLNKIKGTRTAGSNLLAARNLARAIISKLETSGYRLKPKPIQPVATSPSASEPPKSPLKSIAKKSACA